jgi:hypothetical protein
LCFDFCAAAGHHHPFLLRHYRFSPFLLLHFQLAITTISNSNSPYPPISQPFLQLQTQTHQPHKHFTISPCPSLPSITTHSHHYGSPEATYKLTSIPTCNSSIASPDHNHQIILIKPVLHHHIKINHKSIQKSSTTHRSSSGFPSPSHLDDHELSPATFLCRRRQH